LIVTEWNEFRALDLKKVKDIMNGNLIIDLRNIYPIEEMEKHDFNYISVGRGNVKGN